MTSVTRKEFIFLGLGALAEFATACSSSPQRNPVRPTEKIPLNPLEAWRTMAPGDRLKLLEKKQFPKFTGFSLIPEISLAASELRCQITTCNMDVDKMQQGVKILSADDFSRVYEKVHGTKPEQGSTSKFILEFVEGNPPDVINLSSDAIKFVASSVLSPEVRNAYQRNGIDPEISLTKQVIIHGQSHMNQTQTEFTLDQPVKVQLPYSSQQLTLIGMDGLLLKALDPNNNVVPVSGAGEALTEVATGFICSKAGAFASIPPYQYGLDLLEPLFKLAGINIETLLNVYHGKRTQGELMTWLGSVQKGQNAMEKNTPPQAVGAKVLTIVGLTVNLSIPMQTTQTWLEQMYGRRLYSQPQQKIP